MTDATLIADLGDYQAKDPGQALDAALAQVQSHCGWAIYPSVAGVMASVWSPDGRSLFLETLNLTAVTSVVQDGVTVDPATYTFESYGVIQRTYGATFSTTTRVTVTFTHGYSTLPADVRDVVLGLAQRSLNDTRGMVPGNRSGQSVAEGFGPQLTQADEDKLAPYTLVGVA